MHLESQYFQINFRLVNITDLMDPVSVSSVSQPKNFCSQCQSHHSCFLLQHTPKHSQNKNITYQQNSGY